jgi:pilus assembly protein Flp/PilA
MQKLALKGARVCDPLRAPLSDGQPVLLFSAREPENSRRSSKSKCREKVVRILQLAKKLGKDEEGAALVEYTVLLGIMLVAVISTIVLVGGWVNTKWASLWTALQGN